MFFDIYVNDKRVATVGPSDLEHLSVALSDLPPKLRLPRVT
jgi:hypothetical protein